MRLLPVVFRSLAALAALLLAAQAQALTRPYSSPGLRAGPPNPTVTAPAFIDVDLSGWQTVGGFGAPGNTQQFLGIAPGSTVTAWDFIDLSFSTSGDSWLEEFVLSVNNSSGSAFLDAAPSDVAAGGSFGPASGSWASALGGRAGSPFAVADGSLWVTVYETITDAGVNATVQAGTLRIYYDSPAAVPEPGSYVLMGLGLGLVLVRVRRRRSH